MTTQNKAPDETGDRESRGISGGIFFIALATLTYEILLTRIFSVTMWFHFAFLAISTAMFGMTLGAILVYLNPGLFSGARLGRALVLSALGMSVTIVASFLAHLYIPFLYEFPLPRFVWTALMYLAISLPFISGGVCVCLVFTKFPRNIGRFYAFDLAGASLGCVFVVGLLWCMDAPSAVFVVAACAAAGAACFASPAPGRRLLRISAIAGIVFFCFGAVHAACASLDFPVFRLFWVRGTLEGKPLYEKWNSFSRVTVGEHHTMSYKPFGWGLSSTYESPRILKELMLTIDSGAATPITEFKGDWEKLDFLKADVINIVHYLKTGASVLVVGTGGGRDVLSALAFGQRSILGVEINDAIIRALNRKFGDFSGHLDRYPNVKFVNDEARSFIARSKDKYDIIQISFIDTSTATSAGAFAFTENSLYTVEAYTNFLKHLSPGGILSVSRWYSLNMTGEIYRGVALAAAALKNLGIDDPKSHLIVVRNIRPASIFDVGTMLVSPTPFSAADVMNIEALSRRFNYQVVLSPRAAANPVYGLLGSGQDATEFFKKYPLNVSPTTDDRPFFFHMVRLQDMFNEKLRVAADAVGMFNIQAVYILNRLFLVVIVLTFLAILLPLFFSFRKVRLKGTAPLFIFFASIGAGFMLVEVSLMQRLIIFLGHPVYGLCVLLFTLLLASSLGSWSVQGIDAAKVASAGFRRLAVLPVLLAVMLVALPSVTGSFEGSPTVLKILIAVCGIFPLGLFMGMAFPLGMRLIPESLAPLTPWWWGINGAVSVCASVIEMMIALHFGISAALMTGLACYLAAGLSFWWFSRRVTA